MLVLGVETSCDETAVAVATEEGKVLSSVVASQLKVHAAFGGVVPELASRQHLQDLPVVAAAALQQAGLEWPQIQGVAATHGPGLMGALLVGLTWAKAAAFGRGLPFIGVNHLEGHLKAVEIEHPPLPRPFLGLVASGGHTNLFRVDAGVLPVYRLLARTRDDAVGEAFDKVAKLLGLPYPGGPAIEKIAQQSNGQEPRFSQPKMKDGSLGFSYSGLKTAVRYALEDARCQGRNLRPEEVAAAFQKTIVADLVAKTLTAAETEGIRVLALTGGVAANQFLRDGLCAAARTRGLECIVPPRPWCTDNGAMIAVAGAQRLVAGERHGWDLPAVPYLELAA